MLGGRVGDDQSQARGHEAREDTSMTTPSIRRTHRTSRIGAALSVGALIWLVGAAAAFGGNNGTLKIHDMGTPDGTPNNDPNVCAFNVEGFNLDAGQSGYLVFSVQGGDAPQGVDAGPFPFGPANADGFYATDYFGLARGHYMAILYGKADLTDVKAKSKVFKVTCDNPFGE